VCGERVVCIIVINIRQLCILLILSLLVVLVNFMAIIVHAAAAAAVVTVTMVRVVHYGTLLFDVHAMLVALPP
jgi:hypothetical protein